MGKNQSRAIELHLFSLFAGCIIYVYLLYYDFEMSAQSLTEHTQKRHCHNSLDICSTSKQENHEGFHVNF